MRYSIKSFSDTNKQLVIRINNALYLLMYDSPLVPSPGYM